MEIRHRRPFAKPWKLEEQGESFQIRDAAGRILAYVYFEDEPTRRNFSKRLSKDDAADGPANPAPARAGPDCKGDTLANDHRTFPSRHSSAVLRFLQSLGRTSMRILFLY